MASNKPTLSYVCVQSLAEVRTWAFLKPACGHPHSFFGDGPTTQPVEPCASILHTLPGKMEVRHG